MNDFTINIKEDKKSVSLWKSFTGFIYKLFVIKKLNSPVGFIILVLFSLICVLMMIKSGHKTGFALIAGLIGGPLVVISLFNQKFGVTMMLILAFFLLGTKRFVYQMAHADVPLGVAMDLIVVVMVFGLFIRQIEERDWSFAKNQITFFVIAWIGYNILQVANPTAVSKVAWAYTVRGFAGIMVMYFIFAYTIDNIKFLERLLIIWIVLAALGALWGFYQEKFGYTGWEMQSIIDNDKLHLYYIAGRFRKFSFFSDPMMFGIIMSYTGILCISLLAGPFKKSLKILLIILGLFMFNVMLYSGTRAAYVLPMASLAFYFMLRLNAKLIVAGVAMIVLFLVVINMPSSDPNIRRFQTAFKPGDDASYQVREKNQAYIKPFIHSHPLGGGLGSTGVWGERFSPNSMLAKFPPDSGYVRIAVEAGWVGLIIYLGLLFVSMRTGIKTYFRLKDPKVKAYLLAMLSVLFALVVANFPQEAINQYPTNLVFFMMLAIINNAKKLERPEYKLNTEVT